MHRVCTGPFQQTVKSTRYIWIAVWLFLLAHEGSRAASVTLMPSSVCSGVAETPILASQLNGIASISIKVNFDTTQISYLGVRRVHPGISSALVTSNNGQFIIAWFSLNAVQIGNDTLMVVRWTASPYGSSALQFDTQTAGNCEITNLQGTPLGVQYVSGSVQITGPRAPQPLNPLRLFNLNQPSYLFLHRRQPCMQAAVLEVARDSVFSQKLLSAAMPDTTYLYPIPALSPPQGDSVLWWRMGGILQGDTSWSAVGRMSFSLALSLAENLMSRTRAYPNPVQSEFFLEHPAFELDALVQVEMRDLQGRLLWQGQLSSEAGARLRLHFPSNLNNQYLVVAWRNASASGQIILIKSP